MLNYLFILRVVLCINLLIGMQKNYCMIAEAMRSNPGAQSYMNFVYDDILMMIQEYLITHLPPQAYELSSHKESVKMLSLCS